MDPNDMIDDLRAAIDGDDAEAEVRTCTGCGCTDAEPCIDAKGDPCYWIDGDLCSGCTRGRS